MKSKILLFVGVLTFFVSCGLEDVGPSQCVFDYDDFLSDMNVDYNYDISHTVDSEGNSQSLEACVMQRNRTYTYISDLETLRDDFLEPLITDDYCTEVEKNDIREKINDKIQTLNQDIENVWSQCETIYGG